ncbi:outer membrane protein assembly factor BamD [Tundrisphaera lichenicola]|uniref:outer membrane protein assembly factor BamD n=1 Tax=Tundrisphaera lichenicola TaxID=2029860 RepID=UPI003EBE7EF8
MPMSPSNLRRRSRDLLRAVRRGLSIAAILAATGGGSEAGVIADWIASRVAPSSYSADSDSKDGNLMSRWLTRDKTPFASGSMASNSVFLGQHGWEKTKAAPDPQAEAEFAVAKKLFDAGNYAQAEPLLQKMANREIKKGGPWGEKAQYYLAETQFRRQLYVKAHDNFEILIKKYPGTDYVDELVQREFQIAQFWLSSEDPKAKPLPWKARLDGRLPMVDVSSYAIKALDHVRLHDPTGPLADDAALRTADHYHTAGDFETASVYYDQLLTEHPKSPLRERAQLSSIDAKMKGYIGPEYDLSTLDSARETVQRSMAEFPERLASNGDGLYHTLDLINDAAAEHEFTTGMYYVRAMKPISAEYQFGLVMARWPKSKWAGQAKVEMAKIAKAPRKASVPSRIMTQPGAPDPNSMNNAAGGAGSSGSGIGGLGGGGTGSPY